MRVGNLAVFLTWLCVAVVPVGQISAQQGNGFRIVGIALNDRLDYVLRKLGKPIAPTLDGPILDYRATDGGNLIIAFEKGVVDEIQVRNRNLSGHTEFKTSSWICLTNYTGNLVLKFGDTEEKCVSLLGKPQKIPDPEGRPGIEYLQFPRKRVVVELVRGELTSITLRRNPIVFKRR